MKLLDLFPTADVLFKATHPSISTAEEYQASYNKRALIVKENAEVLTAFDRCSIECGPPDMSALQKAFFCTLDAAIRTVTQDEDESLTLTSGKPLC